MTLIKHAQWCGILTENPRQSLLIDLSGGGDKDIDFVVDKYGLPE